MIASNKEDFLFQLHNELHRIGIDADEEIFADFEEHFKASANIGISEEETCRRLGDVKEIARNYLDFESSRINSMVAKEVADRPRVSLTKPGQSVPADLSLKSEEQEPIREYTPEHISEEVYPTANGEAAPLPEYTPKHITPEQPAPNSAPSGNTESADNSTSTGTTPESGEPTLGDALGAAGKAVAAAAVTAGHAVADAFGREEVKNAGKSMAEAVKSAGHAVADAAKNAAEQAKNAAEQAKAEQAAAQDIPRAVNDEKRYTSGDMHGDIPPQTGAPAGSGKDFSFQSVKGMKMDPNAGKLFGVLLLDVLVYSWLLALLAGIDIALYCGGGGLVAAGVSGLFSIGISSFFISRIFFSIFIGSLGLIIILLGVLLTKGIIGIIKSIVISHVKALYNI